MVNQDYAYQLLIQLLLLRSNEWYKRGILQYAVSIGVIEQEKWRSLTIKYCPKYAQTKRFCS